MIFGDDMKTNELFLPGTVTSTSNRGSFAYAFVKRIVIPILLGLLFCTLFVRITTAATFNGTVATCGNHPIGIIYCIPLQIYNNQSTISPDAQLSVWFNSSNPAWSGYISPNGGNICFYDAISGDCMPAWLEGNLSENIDGTFPASTPYCCTG